MAQEAKTSWPLGVPLGPTAKIVYRATSTEDRARA